MIVGLYHSVIISYLSYKRALKILRLYNIFFFILFMEYAGQVLRK